MVFLFGSDSICFIWGIINVVHMLIVIINIRIRGFDGF